MTMIELRFDDLQISAFLHARGFRLVRTEGPAHRKTFVFADVPDAMIQDFYAGTGAVSARKLFDSYRTLRAIARQSLGQERTMNYASESTRG
jgi:hypothetical protein